MRFFLAIAVVSSASAPALAKVRDVVGLYVAPPEHAIVLRVDEKSQDVWRWRW
jgi:hypothetical protein